MLSCEVCEIFINTYFHRTTQFFFSCVGINPPTPFHRRKCRGIKNNSEQLSWLLLEVRLLTKTAFTLIQDTKYVYHKYIVFLKLAFNTLMHSVPKSGTLSAIFCTFQKFCSIYRKIFQVNGNQKHLEDCLVSIFFELCFSNKKCFMVITSK